MPNRPRTLLRAAAAAVTSAAAFAAAGTASASASETDNGRRTAGEEILNTIRYLPVNPLAGTNANPLDNSIGSQIDDFKPVSTADITKPVANSRSVGDLPLLGGAVKTLGGH
ncbi:hypothetical protein [Actinacidiphila oryziradicis]|uniref:hypothetical protein n=1 Tax=Actinacidiphila oryziradicis TaxID=2571141 RepID=UPI00145E00D7|nr:hypothetical protein [Actinacidiphila oryziradicis]